MYSISSQRTTKNSSTSIEKMEMENIFNLIIVEHESTSFKSLMLI